MITRVARAVPMMLAALSSYHAGVSQLVIAGDPDDEQMQAMMQAAGRRYLPFTVTVPIVPEHREALQRVLPWTSAFAKAPADRSDIANAAADTFGIAETQADTSAKGTRANGATAYVCRAFSCESPATSVEELRERLDTLRHS